MQPCRKPSSGSWDVIIVGAGPAGSASAITLASFGWRVLLLEQRSAARFKLGESVSPAAVGLVTHYLGDLDSLPQARDVFFRSAGNVALWSGPEPEVMDFFYTASGHGLCIDRLAFDQALRRNAAAAGACVLTGTRFADCTPVPGNTHYWNVSLAASDWQGDFQSRYLLDCSGRAAVVAKAADIKCHKHDHMFAYAQWYGSRFQDSDHYTRLESGPHGWWYSNRLPGEGQAARRLIVFHTDQHLPAARMASKPEGFEQLLRDSTHLRQLLEAGRYTPLNNRIRGAPAGSQRLEQFAGPGWLAAGDAAQAYDPLSSQGILKALNDGSRAAHCLHYLLKSTISSPEPGHTALENYVNEHEQQWQQYLQQRDYYYQVQARWRDPPFWQSRQVAGKE